jgi:ArsR family transcriptional regulator
MISAEDLELLAQPVRLAIVQRLLNEGELNATAIGARLVPALAQPTVSRHLKTLVEAGLLIRRQSGVEAWFHVDEARARRLGQQLIDFGSTLTAGGDRHGDEDDPTQQLSSSPPPE